MDKICILEKGQVTMKHFKLSSFQNGEYKEHLYDNTWFKEVYPEFDRIVIAPRESHMELILDLLKDFEPPYGILYVLIMPRMGFLEGRYQSVETFSYNEIKDFCLQFADYFQSDARHHIWFASAVTDQLIVYDHHNVIYVYNNNEKCEQFLEKNNFTEEKVVFPVPHGHRYNVENDKYEVQIMESYQWHHFPLKDNDAYDEY